ncbi:hypothetical protein DW355_07865 [Hylemonella gracilis]|uniref:Class I SAM-dependent methyltransferase n=2 Tax=Hylemonella gracilis TaxID=80880 RepID=A0A4P6UMF2_9BURK|nr:hypothetical protein DW355_07865 [Hylemonella gracilis]
MYAPLVSQLIKLSGVQSLADYGAGKRALKHKLDTMGHGAVRYHPYDPVFPEYGSPHPADLVCCIDVLEHIEPHLLDGVLDDLAGITKSYGLFSIHTGPAKKILSDGRNAHIIQEAPSWWLQRLTARFEILYLQPVRQGFWVLVAPRGSYESTVAALDLKKLAKASAAAFPIKQPKRRGILGRIEKWLQR